MGKNSCFRDGPQVLYRSFEIRDGCSSTGRVVSPWTKLHGV